MTKLKIWQDGELLARGAADATASPDRHSKLRSDVDALGQDLYRSVMEKVEKTSNDKRDANRRIRELQEDLRKLRR